jgi:hypothetical protein
MSPLKKLQQTFWRLIYPIFPYVEHFFLFTHQRRRQRFHIGWLAPGKTLEQMKHHLELHYGFGNHFVAWEDEDQVLSWRKLVSFDYQYHLRVFSDGEIRGHYERTPEAAPIKHFAEDGETAKNEDFLRFLGPFVSIHKHIQNPPLHPSKRTGPELTFASLKEKFKHGV